MNAASILPQKPVFLGFVMMLKSARGDCKAYYSSCASLKPRYKVFMCYAQPSESPSPVPRKTCPCQRERKHLGPGKCIKCSKLCAGMSQSSLSFRSLPYSKLALLRVLHGENLALRQPIKGLALWYMYSWFGRCHPTQPHLAWSFPCQLALANFTVRILGCQSNV